MSPLVTAVIVSHDGEPWIPDLLRALETQHRLPDRLIAVDTGSRDDSVKLLEEVLGPEAVVSAPRALGFGAAVQYGLGRAEVRQSLGRRSAGADPDSLTEWIWLLHDDCAPESAALAALLETADERPGVAVIGCKVRGWPHGRHLLSVGVTISGTGRRETGLENRELDQGQHDGRRDVLAVDSCGMLIRRDVWDRLHGFDPNLPLYRDDVDFGWRAARRGLRVVVAPAAVVFHAEAARRGLRSVDCAPANPGAADRRSALYTLLVNCRWWAVPLMMLRSIGGTLVRALGFLLGKAPGLAMDEVAGLFGVLARPERILTGRAQRRRTLGSDRPVTQGLVAPWWTPYRHGLDAIADVLSASWQAGSSALTGGSTTALETGPTDEESEDLPAEQGVLLRVLTTPVVAAFVLTLAMSIVVGRHLLGSGMLQGGALLPAPQGASQWWSTYFAAWHPVGLGSAASAPPYLLVLGLLGIVTLGKAWLVIDILFLFSVPLATLSAYALARRWIVNRWVRIWAAVTYGLLPVLTGATAQGRLGTVVAIVLLPMAARPALRLLAGVGDPDAQWRSALMFGVWLAVLTAFVPAAYLLGLGVAAVGWLVGGRGLPARYVLLGLIVPATVLIPWSWTLATTPSLWWTEAGLTTDSTGGPASALDLALGRGGGFGDAPGWISAGVAIAAAASLLRRDRRGPVLGLWVVGLFALLLGVTQFHHVVTDPASGTTAYAWPGFAVSVVAGCAIASVAAAGDGATAPFSRASFGWRQPVAAAVAVLAAAAPVLGFAWWAQSHPGAVLHRSTPLSVPAYIADAQRSPAQPRTLVLGTDGNTGMPTFELVRGDGLRTGDDAVAPPVGTYSSLAATVARLVSNPSSDDAADLAAYGIGYVVMHSPVRAEVAARLDGTSGLTRAGVLDPDSSVWAVDYPAGRAQLLGSTGDIQKATVLASQNAQVDDQISPSSKPRTLLLNERAETGWRAEFAGAPLEGDESAVGLQTFKVPAGAGRLVVTPDGGLHLYWLLLQVAAIAAIAVAAAPRVRHERQGTHR
jgi:GT2 family glycosyltransferase